MKLHSVRDIDLFSHMNNITDCRTVVYAYRIIRRHVYTNILQSQAMGCSGSTPHDEADTTSVSGIYR